MADPFTTVAAVVSFVDVAIRACKGIYAVIDTWKDAPKAIQRLGQTVQNQESLLRTLRLYVLEHESSNLCIEQHQILPTAVGNELRDISSDLGLLEKSLPSAGSERKLDRRFKWVFDKKKTREISDRLDRRQMTVMACLQVTAQRNGLKIYEQTSNIRGELQQNQLSTDSQLRKVEATMNQMAEAAREVSRELSDQAIMLQSIHTSARIVTENHSKAMDRMNDLFTAIGVNEGHQQSRTFLAGLSLDTLRQVLRAELNGLVMPPVEQILDPYKSSHEAQLKGISKTLNRIASELDHAVHDGHEKGSQVPAVNILESEPYEGTSLPRNAFNSPHDESSNIIGPRFRSLPSNSQQWSRLWSRTWKFHWRVGVLMVHISAFYFKSSKKRIEVQAFESPVSSSARYAYHVSMDFQAAPGLFIARGISLKCESRQDQRGYYEMRPFLSTFAVIPRSAEVFRCVCENDIAGLQTLFKIGLAAPTDRTEESDTLLHYASYHGLPDMCEYLLAEGADPTATTDSRCSPLVTAYIGAFETYCTDQSGEFGFELVTRILIRSGCNLNESLVIPSWDRFWPVTSSDQAQYWLDIRIWQNPPVSLLRWAESLRDQGLDTEQTTDDGHTILMFVMSHLADPCDKQRTLVLTNAVFMLCLFGADASFREPRYGVPALHLLFSLRKWSAESSRDVVDLAAILILYGGADVFAVTSEGCSPTMIAAKMGWGKEWIHALEICGFDYEEVFMEELKRLKNIKRFGHGDSSAVDTEELIPHNDGTVTKRRNLVGDRLIE